MASKSLLEQAQEFGQSVISRSPVIILGSGASAAHGIPGMELLGRALNALVLPDEWNPEEALGWANFRALLEAKTDLESALGAVRLTDRQTAFVTGATRNFILPSDLNAFNQLLQNQRVFPLTRLYRNLFSSTHTTINVVTTNYDRLAEYAADASGYSHFTGFGYGHMQTRAKDSNTRIYVNDIRSRTVCVWKVHGSLDWFRSAGQKVVAAHSCHATPDGYTPLMVTPGIDKYRLTHMDPFRSIVQCADDALESARSYVCIGYGFNDSHIQEKLIQRCDADSVPIVIVTKDLTETTKSFLRSGRCRKYLAIEKFKDGTCLYTNANPEGFCVENASFWQIGEFLNFTIGAE